ncbi:4'-phosphopantetheinyl transferase superfamily protein [Streptomyces sp. NPDC048442]|uniref:4'-phosphopantetheinyl transferase family protein n=1 Tax=Streptomyces sp. NPDC048442 TaxID=3154823 RepID=UPI00341B4C89
MLRTDTVHIWRIDLDTATAAAGALLRTALSEPERDRAAGIDDPVLRARFEAARGAARRILGRYLSRPPDLIGWRTGRWGKPHLAGHEDALRFSLSHCGPLALLAVTGSRDVGVDLERPVPGRNVLALSRRYFTADESALVAGAAETDRDGVFLALWTRKEACTKAAGTRLLGHGLRLPVAGPPHSRGPLRVHDPAGRLPGCWSVRDVPAPPGHRAAVALAGTAPAYLTIRQWEPQ